MTMATQAFADIAECAVRQAVYSNPAEVISDPEITAHFTSSYKYKDQDEKIEAEVAQYTTLKQLREHSPGLYRSLLRH